MYGLLLTSDWQVPVLRLLVPVSDWANTRHPGKGGIWVLIVSLGLSPIPAILAYTSANSGKPS